MFNLNVIVACKARLVIDIFTWSMEDKILLFYVVPFSLLFVRFHALQNQNDRFCYWWSVKLHESLQKPYAVL